jgi:hypothetical protein
MKSIANVSLRRYARIEETDPSLRPSAHAGG